MSLAVEIAEIETLTLRVKRFRLRSREGSLPTYSPGSSLRIHLPVGGGLWNAYSLTSDPWNEGDYAIAVRREDPEHSKGGSIYLHERARVGDVHEIQAPTNHFLPARTARHHLLLAGGIGITPFIAYLPSLERWGHSFELHYAYRDEAHAAFLPWLRQRWGKSLEGYATAQGRRLPVAELLKRQPVGTHVYVCGPIRLIEAVRAAAAELGWPNSRVHFEQFSLGHEAPRLPFTAQLIRSQKSIAVSAAETLLEALERERVPVPYSCRVGGCGTCELRVIRGGIDHRDHCLPPEDREAGRSLISCVSRAANGELVLDL